MNKHERVEEPSSPEIPMKISYSWFARQPMKSEELIGKVAHPDGRIVDLYAGYWDSMGGQLNRGYRAEGFSSDAQVDALVVEGKDKITKIGGYSKSIEEKE